MATTSDVPVTPGSGANVASWSITEDAVTKQIQRVGITDSTGAEVFGQKTDAASTATDATAVSAVSIWKQISKSVQAIATSVAGTLTVATHAVTQSGSWVLSAGAAVIGSVNLAIGGTALTATGNALDVNVKSGVNANGRAADASSAPVALSNEDAALLGPLTETAPAFDTASSGLNGRLQRIAQRLTSIIALLPAALGAGGGLKIDGSGIALPVSIAGSATGHTGSATFTTGTTAYVAFDCVGASGANAAVDLGVLAGVSGGQVLLTSVELEIDSATIISGEANYYLYLYNVTPPSAINDSSSFTLGSGDRSTFLSKIALPNVVVEGVTTATLYCRLDAINQHLLLAGTHLFGYLVTVGAFTPTARVYKITVHTMDL